MRLLATCLVCFLTLIAQAEAVKKAKRPLTIFDSFRSLDQGLSALDAQLNRIDDVVQKAASGTIATSSGKRARQPWTGPSQQMLANVRSLKNTVMALQRRYQRSAGSKSLLPPLLKAAVALDQSAAGLAASKNAMQAKSALQAVRKSRIDLVLSFHALSADYGVLRCERGQWACCQVGQQNGASACRWSCVETPRRCSKGLLGPRSQSASADVVRH